MMENEMVEKEVRKVFLKQAENFDLTAMESEKVQELKQLLEEISPDVKSYFERINVVPTYSAMFK